MNTSPLILGITLARGGSKGIPNKNLTPLHGSPLIKYTLDVAKSCPFTRYIVSTDDPNIANFCLKELVDVPFIRPSELSSDTATSVDALKHAVAFCESQDSVKYDIIVELMCTNPFKTVPQVSNCIDMLISNSADSVITVVKVEEHHPARIKKIIDGKLVDFCVPELSSRRQDLLPEAFIRNGSIYVINRDKLMNESHRFGGSNSFAYVIRDEPSVNIDTTADLILAHHFISSLSQHA